MTGEGSEPGNDITVTFPSGKTSQGKVGQDGQWEVDVPAGEELKPGDKVTAKKQIHQVMNHQVVQVTS
ncbi:hypothetical protein [Staphylococcus aureus]|uniref:hypothetical protein n=1 Tax=Staphylococcus aureus TaxID=1280 RepID=UPI003D324C94